LGDLEKVAIMPRKIYPNLAICKNKVQSFNHPSLCLATQGICHIYESGNFYFLFPLASGDCKALKSLYFDLGGTTSN
jgi:hypothetical protein